MQYLALINTREHQTYTIVCSSKRTQNHWMYAPIFSVDIRGGTTRRTLTNSTPYFVNSTQTYAQKYTNVNYFLD
jgi:hypothetical protein